MAGRSFPLSPRSATSLERGDLIAVPSESGWWACLQVLELKPRARKHFIAGLLPWRATVPPTVETVIGTVPVERALTGIEVFTEGGLEVVGWSPPVDGGQEAWYGPGYIGKVTRVWGWKAAIRHAQGMADGRPWPDLGH